MCFASLLLIGELGALDSGSILFLFGVLLIPTLIIILVMDWFIGGLGIFKKRSKSVKKFPHNHES